jgi:hypothetical protein
LNRKGELQEEFNRTYNPIPFSSESWMYFMYKLCGCLGVEWPRTVKQRIFKYRLDEGMSKTSGIDSNRKQRRLRKATIGSWNDYLLWYPQ